MCFLGIYKKIYKILYIRYFINISGKIQNISWIIHNSKIYLGKSTIYPGLSKNILDYPKISWIIQKYP